MKCQDEEVGEEEEEEGMLTGTSRAEPKRLRVWRLEGKSVVEATWRAE